MSSESYASAVCSVRVQRVLLSSTMSSLFSLYHHDRFVECVASRPLLVNAFADVGEGEVDLCTSEPPSCSFGRDAKPPLDI